MIRALLAGLALLAACRPSDTAGSGAARGGPRLIDFDERGGAFACRAPADWRALEDRGAGGPLVMFFAPRDDSGAVTISVTRYPDGVDRIKTPKDYWQALKLTQRHPSPLETRQINGRTVYATRFDAPRRAGESPRVLGIDREDAVLIPGRAGFFTVCLRASERDYQRALPVFEAIVQSFRPKS